MRKQKVSALCGTTIQDATAMLRQTTTAAQ